MLNPNGTEGIQYWNYSNKSKPDTFTTSIMGTVAAIQEVQKSEYNPDPNAPRTWAFWNDGRPKMNIRILLIQQDGSYIQFEFSPASRAAKEGKRRSIHLDLFALTGNTDMRNLIGKTIRITTQEPPEGFAYGAGNPRPFSCELIEGQVFQATSEMPDYWKLDKVLGNTAVSGGQVVRPSASVTNPTARPMPPAQPSPMPMTQPAGYPQGYVPQTMSPVAPQIAGGYYQPPVTPAPTAPVYNPATGGQVMPVQAVNGAVAVYPADDCPF